MFRKMFQLMLVMVFAVCFLWGNTAMAAGDTNKCATAQQNEPSSKDKVLKYVGTMYGSEERTTFHVPTRDMADALYEQSMMVMDRAKPGSVLFLRFSQWDLETMLSVYKKLQQSQKYKVTRLMNMDGEKHYVLEIYKK